MPRVTCHVSRVQAEHVRRCLESGAKESSLVSLDESLTIARQTCERCLMMLGIIEEDAHKCFHT